MTKQFKISIGTILIICAIGAGLYCIWQYWGHTDKPVIQASQLNPLDGKIIYKIVRIEVVGEDNVFAYAIIRVDEPDSSAQLAWRKIGKSPINLEQFVGKPVYLIGKYTNGKPLVNGTARDQLPAIYLQDQTVIQVEKIIDAQI